MCRYCLDTEPENELLRPCKCTAPVHASCLCRWLAVGDRDARTLRCELCQGRLRARWSLAPVWSLFAHKEGQSILIGAMLRGMYSLFLFSRLYKRCKPLVERWKRPCGIINNKSRSRRAAVLRVIALCRDSVLAMLLVWLSSQMLVRHLRSFFRMTLRFRKEHGRLELLDSQPTNNTGASSRLQRLRISLRSAGGPNGSQVQAPGLAGLSGPMSGAGAAEWSAVLEALARGVSEVTMNHVTLQLHP